MRNEKDQFIYDSIRQFPHCDSRVLHAPGTCQFCDKHPDWQALRMTWGIAFTGEQSTDKTKCPAEKARGLDSINRWGGNIPQPLKPPVPKEDVEKLKSILQRVRDRFVGEKMDNRTGANIYTLISSLVWLELDPKYSVNLFVALTNNGYNEIVVNFDGNEDIRALVKEMEK